MLYSAVRDEVAIHSMGGSLLAVAKAAGGERLAAYTERFLSSLIALISILRRPMFATTTSSRIDHRVFGRNCSSDPTTGG